MRGSDSFDASGNRSEFSRLYAGFVPTLLLAFVSRLVARAVNVFSALEG